MKGRLSLTEKYTIQGMLHNTKTVPEIAKTLNRSLVCIQNYVDGELNKLHKTVVEAQIEPTKPKVDLTTLKKLPKDQAKKTMGYKTMGDKTGVAIMNSATSNVGDEFLKEMDKKKITRSGKDNLYDLGGNKLK